MGSSYNNRLFILYSKLPERLGVIGAGPIGLELAQAFQRFGSQVTVFSRSDKILPKEDPDAAKIVENALRRDGVTFAFNVNYKGLESRGGKPPVMMVLEVHGLWVHGTCHGQCQVNE